MGSFVDVLNEGSTVFEGGDLKRDYERDGLIRSLEVISPQNAAGYAHKLEQFVTSHRHHPDFQDWTYGKTHLLLEWIPKLCAEGILLDVVEALIGPDIVLWDASIPLKPPQSSGYFGWHQDGAYWPIEPLEKVVSVWVALSAVNPLNGGVRMIPGSHRFGPLAHDKTFDKKSMLRRGQRIAVPVDETKAIDIVLQPGQASFHHTLMLHGSGANRTDTWRLGVIANFAAADVGPSPGHEESAILMRGSPQGTRFTLEPPPASDLSPQALTRYAEVVARSSRRYQDVPSVT